MMACLVYDFFNEDNDIVVMSCGCTYHPFCFIMYIMELKVNACARSGCQKVFSNSGSLVLGSSILMFQWGGLSLRT
jgi:hypothetical protein